MPSMLELLGLGGQAPMPPASQATPSWFSQPGNSELLLGLGAGLLGGAARGGGGLARGLSEGALQGMQLRNQSMQAQQQGQYMKEHADYFHAQAQRDQAAQDQTDQQNAAMDQFIQTLPADQQKLARFDKQGFMKNYLAKQFPDTSQPPHVQTFVHGGQEYQAAWNPQTGAFEPIAGSEGPRWAPPASTNVTVNPPNVTVDTGGKKQTDAVQEEYGKTFSTLQANALAGDSSLSKLQQLDRLLSGINTGKFTPAATEFKAGLKSLGIDPTAIGLTDNVGQAQAAAALSNEMALEARNPANGGGMPGAMSDSDRAFLASMQPGLATTPEGRKMMVDFRTRQIKRNQDLAKMAREYVQEKDPISGQPRGYIDSGFYDRVQKFSDENPLAPPTASPEDAAKLKPGTVYMTTDGRVMVR